MSIIHTLQGSSRPAGKRCRLAVAITLLSLAHATASHAADRTIHVSTRGVDSADGSTPATAVRTLARAFTLAGTTPSTIHVTAGRFEEPRLEPPSNTSIRGSWDLSFDKQEGFSERKLRALKPKEDLCGVHTCVVAKDTDRTLVLAMPNVALERLVVIGPDRSKTMGSNSFALVVQSAGASLTEVVVQAGSAGPGRPGSAGQPGRGLCSGGGGGGHANVIWTSAISPGCEIHKGDAGDSVAAHGRTANGGGPGDAGDSQCSVWPTAKNSDLDNGKAGGTGDTGIEGPAGESIAPDEGWMARDPQGQWQWHSRSVPKNGLQGGAGGGGGGGGAGGSWDIIYWCLANYVAIGGHGHVGNNGGCGGYGGNGGETGGNASALLTVDATVKARDIVVFGGQGGAGGVGGTGGGGSAGGSNDDLGGSGSSVRGCGTGPTRTAGRGGSGGHGGAGGGGGGGAGGNGGSEFAVIEVGKGVIEHEGVYRIVAGAPGTGSIGGKGAASGTIAPSGNEGLTAKQIKLDFAK